MRNLLWCLSMIAQLVPILDLDLWDFLPAGVLRLHWLRMSEMIHWWKHLHTDWCWPNPIEWASICIQDLFSMFGNRPKGQKIKIKIDSGICLKPVRCLSPVNFASWEDLLLRKSMHIIITSSILLHGKKARATMQRMNFLRVLFSAYRRDMPISWTFLQQAWLNSKHQMAQRTLNNNLIEMKITATNLKQPFPIDLAFKC